MRPKAVEHAEPKATVQPNRRRRAPSALAKRRSGETCKHILALIRRPLCLSHSRPNTPTIFTSPPAPFVNVTFSLRQPSVFKQCHTVRPKHPMQWCCTNQHAPTAHSRHAQVPITNSLIDQLTQRRTRQTSSFDKNALSIRKNTVLAKIPGYSTTKAGDIACTNQPTTHPTAQ
jgi:hypothetical protein